MGWSKHPHLPQDMALNPALFLIKQAAEAMLSLWGVPEVCGRCPFQPVNTITGKQGPSLGLWDVIYTSTTSSTH